MFVITAAFDNKDECITCLPVQTYADVHLIACNHHTDFEKWRTGDNVTHTDAWWHHQMETFSTLLAFCEGNSPVTVELPSQWPVTRSFDFFFDLRLE